MGIRIQQPRGMGGLGTAVLRSADVNGDVSPVHALDSLRPLVQGPHDAQNSGPPRPEFWSTRILIDQSLDFEGTEFYS